MSCNHLQDCIRCGGEVDDLEERVLLLSNGLQSAIGYIEGIVGQGWVAKPGGLIDDLKTILRANGHTGPLASLDKYHP